MKSIRTIVCCCTFLLAVEAWAIRTSASGQSSQQEGGQPQQQAQPPQAAQPQPSSIDEQVKVLALELNLSTDQQAKLKTILEDQRTQGMAIVNDKAAPREEKIQKLSALRQSTIANVRAMLNDDQKKKLEQMLQEPEQAPPKDQQSPPPK